MLNGQDPHYIFKPKLCFSTSREASGRRAKESDCGILTFLENTWLGLLKISWVLEFWDFVQQDRNAKEGERTMRV